MIKNQPKSWVIVQAFWSKMAKNETIPKITTFYWRSKMTKNRGKSWVIVHALWLKVAKNKYIAKVSIFHWGSKMTQIGQIMGYSLCFLVKNGLK